MMNKDVYIIDIHNERLIATRMQSIEWCHFQ